MHNASAGNPDNPDIAPSASINSPGRYAAVDRTNVDIYIDGQIVAEGGRKYIQFSVVAQLKDPSTGRTIRGKVSGKDLFAAMAAYFGMSTIDGVKGVWIQGIGLDTNIDQFNAFAQAGDSDSAAAAKTWTGEQASLYGFSAATVTFKDPGNRPYREVRATFNRPQAN